MSQSGYIALALCSLVTLLLRVLPILLMSRIRLGKTARDWLGFIPCSIMAALVAAELILKPEWSASGLSISALAAASASPTIAAESSSQSWSYCLSKRTGNSS